MRSSGSRPFAIAVRVYLEDTDAQGVVYNASYFRFMERARTECLRDKGIDHGEFREAHGINLVLARIEARFVAPSRLSDMLSVEANVTDIRGARIVFEQRIRRLDADQEAGGPLICEGLAEVACMDVVSDRPRRFPEELVSKWLQ